MGSKLSCCFGADEFCKDLQCKVEKTDNGLILRIEGKDPVKVAALKKMIETNLELCCSGKDACC